ncbi:uncharacterized protein LOC108112618 [Drosophila eugracilis]|uniref:uncharacterized protein LOC108112618 n=1 Tax=Drosophila eugracilis TaxID=29029 RepID=UPI0007E5C1C6|nr:uncharacterized protein LOC108112618 [Drosophila eugracilis]
MTRTEISTPGCGTITKLVVSIDSGETFITYSDATTRSFCSNPTWLNLQNGMMEQGPVVEPNSQNYQKEVAAFLERHFGRNPQVKASMATHQSLASNNLKLWKSIEDFQKSESTIWHTWLVEKVRFPPTQCAVIKEWIDPFTETLESGFCSWHLKNCMAWQLITSNRKKEAKCFCLRIKNIMDIANNLVDPEVEQNGPLVSALTEQVLNATDMLKKLNNLLERQEKCNRRYIRLYKVEEIERL